MNENIRLATQRDARAVEEAVNGWWKEDKKKAVHRLDWWKEARFGCFVHWGVYAVAGGLYKGRTTGYAEHLERALTIPLEEYKEEMIDKFLAEKFIDHFFDNRCVILQIRINRNCYITHILCRQKPRCQSILMSYIFCQIKSFDLLMYLMFF